MALFHLHADDAGETHLTEIAPPVRETEAGTVRGLTGLPVTRLGIGEFVERKPDVGLHPAPRRQVLVVLQGTLEIVTTTDDQAHLHPGDVLLADDVGSKGHHSRDVGEEPLSIMAIALDPSWPGLSLP